MDWFAILPALAVAALAGGVIASLTRRCRAILAELHERAEKTRLGKVEIELAELRELYGYLLESHKKLRARTTKREAANGQDADAVPDWRADPTAARKALERKHGIPSLD